MCKLRVDAYGRPSVKYAYNTTAFHKKINKKLFVNNSYTKLHEDTTKGLVAYNGSKRYGETDTNGKGKAVPLQAWSGPEGSRKLRLPEFMTTAQEGGKVVSHTHRPHLPPGNPPGTHFC